MHLLDYAGHGASWNDHNDVPINGFVVEFSTLQAQQHVGETESGTGVDPGFITGSNTKELDYFQLNFAEIFNHKRPIKPYQVDDVPVAGYNGGEAYMLCLSKCQTQFNDGVCYPQTYQWSVPSVTAAEIWITSNLFWWGNHGAGQPIAKITVSGDRGTISYDMIGNGHTGEWNQNYIKPAPGVTIHSDVIGITTYESRFHIARFPFEQMKVSSIKVDLLSAPLYSGDKFGVFAIYGITLVGGDNH